MKKKIIWILAALAFAGVLLYFVPIPCRVDKQLDGISWGTYPSESAAVTVKGTYLRYLFKNNRFYGDISFDGLPDQYRELYSPCELLDYSGVNGKTGQLWYYSIVTHQLDRVGEMRILGNFDKVLLSTEDGYISAPASTHEEAVSLAHEVTSDDFGFDESERRYITITPVDTSSEPTPSPSPSEEESSLPLSEDELNMFYRDIPYERGVVKDSSKVWQLPEETSEQVFEGNGFLVDVMAAAEIRGTGQQWLLVRYKVWDALQTDLGWIPAGSVLPYDNESQQYLLEPLTIKEGAGVFNVNTGKAQDFSFVSDVFIITQQEPDPSLFPTEEGEYVTVGAEGGWSAVVKKTDLVYPAIIDDPQ